MGETGETGGRVSVCSGYDCTRPLITGFANFSQFITNLWMACFTVNKNDNFPFLCDQPLPWCCHIWLQCRCCDSVAKGM